MEDVFSIANKNFKSRLIVGTGKYKDFKETADAVKASGADIVTVAVRRVNILDKEQPLLMDYLNPKTITYLPNTAGCYTSEDALRTLRMAREIGDWRLFLKLVNAGIRLNALAFRGIGAIFSLELINFVKIKKSNGQLLPGI